jgi:hypothetical protein
MKSKLAVHRYFKGNNLVHVINFAAGLSIFFFGVSIYAYGGIVEIE